MEGVCVLPTAAEDEGAKEMDFAGVDGGNAGEASEDNKPACANVIAVV